jgi:transaldolase/glucose-6-phosphate isomerase
MGGSSLGPEVIARSIGVQKNGLELLVLDSTVPQQVATFAARVDVRKTVFLVASKSGGTTEPNAFKQFFYQKVAAVVGVEKAGDHFLAITDPGSSLDALATKEKFRATLHGTPSIGGRYSVLSPFGMLPAALLGIDTAAMLDQAQAMVDACGPQHAARDNAGVALGIILGGLALRGRDKVTFVATPGLASLGSWLEQLIAESSGKLGKGIVPIDGEVLAKPERYASDRVFVRLAFQGDNTAALDAQLDALHAAGHPVLRIEVPERLALGQEFFRWEVATAVACAVLELNAFNQPDVEAAKVATRRLTAAFEASGELPDEQPFLEDGSIAVFVAGEHARRLQPATTLSEILSSHMASLTKGDYVAINAYIEMDAAHAELLQAMRQRIRDTRQVATTVGFGPRFLHSTGQLHKGGPNNGVFLQLTAGEPQRLPVPGQKWSFGELVRFQAQGDLEVLLDRNRRALRIHLGNNSVTGLRQLRAALDAVLQQS